MLVYTAVSVHDALCYCVAIATDVRTNHQVINVLRTTPIIREKHPPADAPAIRLSPVTPAIFFHHPKETTNGALKPRPPSNNTSCFFD